MAVHVDTALPIKGGADPAAAARMAEEAGYDAVWASELDRDPFLQLAVATTATERIGLGTGIAVAFARSPMNVASMAHDLQRLSGGRFMLGLGTQVRAHITRRFSMPWSEPAARMREYVQALRAIWSAWETGERLAFEGRFYSHTLMTPMFTPAPHGHGTPPVVVAAVGDLMTEVAGEVGDGILFHSFLTERYLREHTLTALERGRRLSRRPDFQRVGGPFVATGSTPEQISGAAEATRNQIAFYASTPSYRPVLEAHGWGELGVRLHALSRAGDWKAMTAAVDDEVLYEFAAVGTPEEAADTLATRYGDVFDRFTLVTPYDLDENARARVAARLRERT
ncbi:TIGR03617 family F420-dependent LLM class oxidoreductase [Streptomyces brasiliensis]|uniref:LLM class F420-dependent oxidoreductase n=1 Tax=Streptomyces brasiliensis TaxID=1954 RepID=A0A917L3Y1_9ACTN|nr:TIGR03617 family F420-dependent LLM class oxidoreductase [Streptomyces brasiliensis]GGJ40885.1 LLM class F420-dependent oxidoreductase [Streptomyces brasiliensis]